MFLPARRIRSDKVIAQLDDTKDAGKTTATEQNNGPGLGELERVLGIIYPYYLYRTEKEKWLHLILKCFV